MSQQPIWVAHTIGKSTFAFQVFFFLAKENGSLHTRCNPTEHWLNLGNVTQWSLPIALRDNYLAPMDFCQQKGRRYWTESETRIFRGAHSIEEYPLILPWENVCVFGWVLPCLLSLQSILPFTSLSNIDRNINLEPKGVTLTHPSCGWFENNKARHKTIIDNRNFSFSKSLFTLMQKLQKNVLSYSLCFSGRIWRTRQEGVSHRRRGFALHIWCKETRTAVDTQVPLFSEDHERTVFFSCW